LGKEGDRMGKKEEKANVNYLLLTALKRRKGCCLHVGKSLLVPKKSGKGIQRGKKRKKNVARRRETGYRQGECYPKRKADHNVGKRSNRQERKQTAASLRRKKKDFVEEGKPTSTSEPRVVSGGDKRRARIWTECGWCKRGTESTTKKKGSLYPC